MDDRLVNPFRWDFICNRIRLSWRFVESVYLCSKCHSERNRVVCLLTAVQTTMIQKKEEEENNLTIHRKVVMDQKIKKEGRRKQLRKERDEWNSWLKFEGEKRRRRRTTRLCEKRKMGQDGGRRWSGREGMRTGWYSTTKDKRERRLTLYIWDMCTSMSNIRLMQLSLLFVQLLVVLVSMIAG